MLFYSPDKLKDCIELTTRMHNVALGHKEGHLQIMMAVRTPRLSCMPPKS